MKKFLLASTALAVLGVSVTMTVMAQPPGGDQRPGDRQREGGPRGGGPRDGGLGEPGRPPMPNPLVAALDTDGDHVISEEELRNATASLLTLDKNKDGKLSDDETRPPRPEGRGPEGRGPEGRGPEGRGPEGRGPVGPPNPERFVEDAMRFDADGNGMLDKAELTKFAEEMGNRQGRPPEGGPGRGGPNGDRAPGGRGRGQEGDRPRRPLFEE